MNTKKRDAFEPNYLWGCTMPHLVSRPSYLPVPLRPLDWALKVAAADKQLKATALRSIFGDIGGSKDQMVYVSRGAVSLSTRLKLVEAVRAKAPVQLQVDSFENESPEYRRFIEKHLAPAFNARHPFSYYLDCAMFATAGGHKYNVHNDLADGFLYQLFGKKKVVTWDVDPRFFEEVIFDHDFSRRKKIFFGKMRTFEMGPGEGIYLPRGVLHEISVPKGGQSVSLSFRAEHVYSIVNVCRGLSRLAGDATAYQLPPSHSHWSKFKAKEFDPSRYRWSLALKPADRTMPEELSDALCKVVICKNSAYKKQLPDFLNRWWRWFSLQKRHPGARPAPPKERGEWLQEQERRRIASRS